MMHVPGHRYVSVRRSDDGDEFAATLDINHNSDANPHIDHNTDDEYMPIQLPYGREKSY